MNIPGIAALLGTVLWLHTGNPIFLLAWALPLMHRGKAGRVEHKENTAPPKGPIPPPVGMQRYGEPPAIPPNPLPPVPDANLGREHWWSKPVAGGRP